MVGEALCIEDPSLRTQALVFMIEVFCASRAAE